MILSILVGRFRFLPDLSRSIFAGQTKGHVCEACLNPDWLAIIGLHLQNSPLVLV